jgi:signal peptidase I
MVAAHESTDPARGLRCELAAEVLRSFGTLRFPASGHSMLPVIWPGDTLIVDRVTPAHVRPGDVVVFRRDGSLCAHRVLGKENHLGCEQWIMQGDALPAPDAPVNEAEILGRVSFLIRDGKLQALASPSGVIERMIPTLVRRSMMTGRALSYLHRVRRKLQEPPLQ